MRRWLVEMYSPTGFKLAYEISTDGELTVSHSSGVMVAVNSFRVAVVVAAQGWQLMLTEKK
jgi:hypothetical protein